MRIKRLSIVIIAVLLLLLSAPAFAQKRGMKSGRVQNTERIEKRDFRGRNTEQIFTEEQKEAIENLRLGNADELKSLRNKLNELQAKQQTLTSENAKLEDIHKNIDEMSEVKLEMTKLRASQQYEIRAMLTDEQLLKFDNLRENRRINSGKDFSRNGKKGRKGEQPFRGRR